MRTLSRRRGQEGFTLVELLVVIAILGILAGVVVFAVRGAGDKGKANAAATDARIVRTALEVYCAQYGHYPADPDGDGPGDAMGVLVSAQLLASRSTYTKLTTGDGLPEGLCGAGGTATPKHYHLDIDVPPPPTCPDFDLFCDVGSVPGGPSWPGGDPFGAMVSLPSGKVLAFTRYVVSVYDPTAGDKGAWTNVDYPPGPDGAEYVPGWRFEGTATLIRSRPGHQDDCSPNCGKVLAHLASDGWWIYDPDSSSTPWTYAGDSVLDSRAHGDPQNPRGAAADQILGASCDPYCGQFLMVYDAALGVSGKGPNAELWDPKAGKFAIVTTPIGPRATTASVVALKDGRVLVTSGYASRTFNPPVDGWTAFFVPEKYKGLDNPGPGTPGSGVETGPIHNVQHDVYGGNEANLGNGDVLFVDYQYNEAEVFQPGTPGTPDKWISVPSCGTPATHCKVLTALAGGREVLAVEIQGEQDWSGIAIRGWRFDPLGDGGKGVWTPTDPKGPPAASTRQGALIDGGPAHLHQVVTAGLGPGGGLHERVASSQLYKAPAPGP